MNKNRGGLLKPSPDVIKVCYHTEKMLKFKLNTLGVTKVGNPQSILQMITNVLKETGNCVFSSLNEHATDHYVTFNHKHLLIKTVCNTFLSQNSS